MSDFGKTLRPEAREAPESGIVEVFNYGRHREGLIPLWVGEGDLPTPAFISEAAAKSLRDGETFYTYQRGIPALRAAIAAYHERVYEQKFDPERFFVTSGGMAAIQHATRMVAGNGDEVVIPTPAWPNFAGASIVAGARPVEVPMRFGNAGWKLDLDRLFDAVTPRTRAIFVNSPSNPTGWTATLDELRAVLAFARQRGLWIIADEVYHRFYYAGARSPSFYDIAEAQDRLLFVNTFSKNWAMTGWRIGWLAAPVELGPTIENLIQYSSSGTATFLQQGATAALEEGEDFIKAQVSRAQAGRDVTVAALGATGRVRFGEPEGAFYLFLAVDGEPDSRDLAFRLVDEANVGLAPGGAFGKAGEGYLRLCFARDAGQMSLASERLAAWLRRS